MRASILLAALLSGCATSAFQEQAEFPLSRYAGATEFEQLLDKVNLEANRHRPCLQIRSCQDGLPSRDDLQRSAILDAKGFAMAKAYALQDAGIDESRMRVASFPLMNRSHTVLVVDERYVLDYYYANVQGIDEYNKFRVRDNLAALPETLMLAGRPGGAAVGR